MGWLLVGAGVFSLAGALFNWQFFMNHRRARLVSKLLGQTGARLFYGVLGMVLAILGALAAAGILDWSSEP